MKHTLKLLIMSAAFLAFAGFSQASNITATLNSIYPTASTQGTVTGGNFESIASGLLTFTSNSNDEFFAFCGEPTQSINFGEPVTFNVTALNNVELAQVMAAYQAGPQDAISAQGAQWAIWELLRDPSANLSSGLVKMKSGTVRDKANEFLDTYTSFAPATNVVWLSSPNRQDMIAIIPEPRAALLGAFGMLALLRRRRA